MQSASLKDLLENAYELARKLSKDGKILGRVTRSDTVIVGARSLINVEVSFEDYLASDIKRGQLLALVSVVPRSVIVGQVERIARADLLASLGIKEIRGSVDPSGLMTSTVVSLRPVSELSFRGSASLEEAEVTPVVSPVDPQSPVFVPKAEVVEKALKVPKDGVVLGNVFEGFRQSEAKIRLDSNALRHHVLVVGSTGAGKTTLLKRVVVDPYEKQVVVFDRQGDFVRFAVERLEGASVVIPVTNDLADFLNLVKSRYCGENAYYYSEDTQTVACDPDEKRRIMFYPYSIRFSEVAQSLPQITPYMSDQASDVWPSVYLTLRKYLVEKAEKLKKEKLKELFRQLFGELKLVDLVEGREVAFDEKVSVSESVDHGNRKDTYKIVEFIREEKVGQTSKYILEVNFPDVLEYVMKEVLELAPQTISNVNRNLKALNSYGIFDRERSVYSIRDVLAKERTVIVDLSYVLERTFAVEPVSVLAYKLLNEVYSFKDSLYHVNPKSVGLTLVLIDEAHELFPQAKGEISKGNVEAMINKVLRLGRVRGLGVVLATHMPEDLNPLVLQLTNTKIVMRNSYDVLKELRVEDFADVLTNANPGLALITGLDYNDVLFQAVPP